MKIIKRISLLLLVVLIGLFSGCGLDIDIPENPDTSDNTIRIGDILSIGTYEQDNDSTNGKEPIEWRVLDVQDGKALVISRFCLDYKPYNETMTDVTWESCTLRKWLNRTFYDSSFRLDEKSNIVTSMIENEDNEEYGTDGGNNTEDKIFLLSVHEAENYFSSDSDRIATVTEYAKYTLDNENTQEVESSFWWLRTPDCAQSFATVVEGSGHIGYQGDGDASNVNMYYIAVRPAMWIDIENNREKS